MHAPGVLSVDRPDSVDLRAKCDAWVRKRRAMINHSGQVAAGQQRGARALSRRHFLVGSAATAGVALLAACGGSITAADTPVPTRVQVLTPAPSPTAAGSASAPTMLAASPMMQTAPSPAKMPKAYISACNLAPRSPPLSRRLPARGAGVGTLWTVGRHVGGVSRAYRGVERSIGGACSECGSRRSILSGFHR